jgi:hypothetical protein
MRHMSGTGVMDSEYQLPAGPAGPDRDPHKARGMSIVVMIYRRNENGYGN